MTFSRLCYYVNKNSPDGLIFEEKLHFSSSLVSAPLVSTPLNERRGKGCFIRVKHRTLSEVEGAP